jgi:hypothetical protein
MSAALKLENINLQEYWEQREKISTNSGTTLDTFRPVIPWQRRALIDIRKRFDYALGTHDVLLSGSVGSAKSIFLAHLAITHCLQNIRACVGVFRMSMTDLRDTIFKDILEHMEADGLTENKDYWVNSTRCQVKFRNGSTIITKSFSDKKYTKVRSLKLSMAVFEEFIEFDGEHEQAFKEVKNRLGRIPHITECLCIAATNPGDPASWIYNYFIEGSEKHETRHVYYSLTFDNPFLKTSYIKGIIRDLDEKQVLRMVFGRWLSIKSDVIYYQFGEYNVKKYLYPVNPSLPIHISWDFNIGSGKPFSCCVFQCWLLSDGTVTYHFFDEVVIEGMRTLDSCEQLAEKGILDNFDTEIVVHGDAAGGHNDTRSKRTDYDIIMQYLQNYQRRDGQKLRVIKKVPNANPPIRTRHNKLNGLMKNAMGEVRLIVYSNCETLIKGFKLTKLKDNGSMIEDDSASCPWQHVTTAAGYGVIASEKYFLYEKQTSAIKERMNYG